MSNYSTLQNILENNVRQNSQGLITGSILQSTLTEFIETLGTESGFMGFLSNVNKPTSVVDGKQFYIGYNASTTAVTVNLSDVGLGEVSMTRDSLYLVHNTGGSWQSVNIAEGLSGIIADVSDSIPSHVTELVDGSNYNTKPNYIEDSGNVTIDLKWNTIYYINDCVGLTIQGYSYPTTDDSNIFPPTFIVVKPSTRFDVDISRPTAYKRAGDTWTLEGDGIYIITVRGQYFSVDKYV